MIDGTTANISRVGALIVCQGSATTGDLPREGEMLAVDVALPNQPSVKRRCLRGQASVVRVEMSGTGELLLAVRFHNLKFGAWQGKQLVGLESETWVSDVVM